MAPCAVYRLTLLCGVLLLLLSALTPREARAADTDVTVNDPRDLPDPSPNLGPDCASTAGTCTLRAAIQRANHQIGTHIIRLPAGTFKISRPGTGENDAETGDLDIKGNILITGRGAKNTILDGGGLDRVFDVHNGSLILVDLTVRGGNTNAAGGGIRATANLTLNRVHLHSNQADGPGGISTDSDLSVVRSTISNNTSRIGRAGGIEVNPPLPPALTRSVSIRESTISGNVSSTNISAGSAAVVFGVGKYNAEILHSTIARNSRGGVAAGGLSTQPGTAKLTMSHTILAENIPVNCPFFGSMITDFKFSADSDLSCGFSSTNNNFLGVNAQLGALQDQGGPTPTHFFNNPQLRDGGAVGGTLCSGVDQRGLPRPVDFDGDGVAKCDIGAIELQGPPGIAVLEPDNATVRQGSLFHLNYLWRVPPDQNWHDLKTLDLRIVERDKNDADEEVLFWLRWSEATNTFQLIDPATGQPRGPAFPAGSNHLLWTESVVLDVRDSSSEGSGPTGVEVTLHLTLLFLEESEAHEPFTLEVTAVDDEGQTQPFLALGSVAVRPPKRQPR